MGNKYNYSEIRGLPNFYNLALLLSVGYEVEEISINEKAMISNMLEVKLIKENCMVGSKPVVILPIYARENIHQLHRMCATVLEYVTNEIRILPYTPTTKNFYKELLNKEKDENFFRVLSGSFPRNVQELFKNINRFKDPLFNSTKTSSLAELQDKLTHFQSALTFDRIMMSKTNKEDAETQERDIKAIEQNNQAIYHFVDDLMNGYNLNQSLNTPSGGLR